MQIEITHFAISVTKLFCSKISFGGMKLFGISAGVVNVVENSEKTANVQITWNRRSCTMRAAVPNGNIWAQNAAVNKIYHNKNEKTHRMR